MSEKYQLDKPNSHYLANLENLNLTNNASSLNRLPTLGEILANKTKLPVSLFNFYEFMRHVEHNSDYLDFWFDLVNHLNLCKHYVRGLRESIARHSHPSNVPSENRDSFPLSERSKHKSLSSLVLLELIINDHILEDSDSNRLSQFLRGDININEVDPKLKQLIEHYNTDHQENHPIPPLPIIDTAPYSNLSNRNSSQSRLLEELGGAVDEADILNESIGHVHERGYRSVRNSSINPLLLERLIKDSDTSSTSFISRQNLKQLLHNLLLKYFVEDSEKNLNVPQKIGDFIRTAIEVDGRDDPDVFNGVKKYVFGRVESEHLPHFLNFVAIKNVSRTINARIIIGFFFLFALFWIAYTLIFLNYPKRFRAPITVSFILGFYALVLLIYRIDPLLVLFRLSESFIPGRVFHRVDDTFIYKLLLKRSAWVVLLILILSAAFSALFCLVPGKRL